MITLYEILEVSEKASDEIIEKVYKVLAKRYHPDLQTPENKQDAEEKMKQINEAYSTLSDKNKRAEYDAGLKVLREQEEIRKRNEILQQSNVQTRIVYTNIPEEPVQNTTNIRYDNQYNDSYNNQYSYVEIKKQYERENFKAKLIGIRDVFISIVIIILIIGVLWLIPPTREMMIEFYNDNMLLQAIVKAFKAMW